MKNYQQLVQHLNRIQKTIATAESCTGGLIAKLITDVPGSSKVFIGGIVSYSNEMKTKLLGVNENTLTQHGAVSENTVSEMLDGIRKITNADIVVAVSGIAGPTGGTIEKPVGTVFIGIISEGKKVIQRFQFKGSRKNIRKQASDQIINLIDQI